jgi:hypothetical protein
VTKTRSKLKHEILRPAYLQTCVSGTGLEYVISEFRRYQSVDSWHTNKGVAFTIDVVSRVASVSIVNIIQLSIYEFSIAQSKINK